MSESRTVHERMAAALADLSFIPKQRSQGVNYEFRGIDAVMNVLHGVLAKHGLFTSPRVLDDWQVNLIPGTKDRQQVQAIFRVCVDMYAEDGSMVTLGPGLAQSHDYGDKAVYQAQQNAIKYVLLEAFCIPTSEQDMDAREADPVSARRQDPGGGGGNATMPADTPAAAGQSSSTRYTALQQSVKDAMGDLTDTQKADLKALWTDDSDIPRQYSRLTDEQCSQVLGWIDTVRETPF